MNAVLTSTPPRTQAAILRRVIAEKHPKFALGDIAHHFDLTMDQLQAILRRYGYPDAAVMRRHAADLELEADELATGGPRVHEPTPADLDAAESIANDQQPTRPRLITVAVADLHTDAGNLRDELPDIEDLADSIKEMGLMQPIVVRRDGDRLVVVAGHRRLAAIRMLRWDQVDVISQGPMRPDRVVAAMLIENGQRVDLDPIEEARGYRQLAQMGLTHAEIAKRVGRSTATIHTRLELLNLPADEQEQIRAGALSLNYVHSRAKSQRQQARLREGGRERGRPQGAKTKPYFGDTHPLAKAARCDHRGKPKVGGVGCGECWEQAIRADERRLNLEDPDAGSQA